jgi:hypothetical protein
LYASQGRASANDLAARAHSLFQEDAALSDFYNREMAHAKWDHMMDQTHIGYTYWNQPPENTMPKVSRVPVPPAADMGVAVEGSSEAWPGASGEPALPEFDAFNQPSRFIDVFNRGQAPFEFSAVASAPWIVLSAARGTVEKEQRLWVSVDWSTAPRGSSDGSVKIARPGATEVTVKVRAFNPAELSRSSLDGFVEANGYVSIEAEHFTKKIDTAAARWEKIADYGRTLSSMTVFPVTATRTIPQKDSPCLEYRMYLFDPDQVTVQAILAPTLNFVPGRGLRFAVSFDDQPPQVLDALARNSLQDWEGSVKDSVRGIPSAHHLTASGYHTLKFWMVDPGVVLQKLIVDLGGVKPSYLGPPESAFTFRRNAL